MIIKVEAIKRRLAQGQEPHGEVSDWEFYADYALEQAIAAWEGRAQ